MDRCLLRSLQRPLQLQVLLLRHPAGLPLICSLPLSLFDCTVVTVSFVQVYSFPHRLLSRNVCMLCNVQGGEAGPGGAAVVWRYHHSAGLSPHLATGGCRGFHLHARQLLFPRLHSCHFTYECTYASSEAMVMVSALHMAPLMPPFAAFCVSLLEYLRG